MPASDVASISTGELAAWVAADPAAIIRDLGPVVRLTENGPSTDDTNVLRSLPIVLLATESDAPQVRAAADAVLHDDMEPVLARIRACPLASIALAVLLRSEAHRDITTGLLAESATYSLLLAGPEFLHWRARTPVHTRADHDADIDPHRVTTQRYGETLHITLDRGAKHNAFDRAMRDAVIDALSVAATDPGLRVVIDGRGPSFCSGGDLDEFGPAVDVATGHAIRLAMSAGRIVAAMADRVEIRLHGHCLGAGIEFPAFAGRVIAHPDARFGLPELGFGLVPGAGGTVSAPRRIGRQRTMRLALTGEMISAQTALEWGLVDSVVDAMTDDPNP